MEKLIQKIKETAAKEALGDDEDEDSSVYDCCGGNIDDAYSAGCEDGEVIFARQLLEMIKARDLDKGHP
jgi:hypothetical protein